MSAFINNTPLWRCSFLRQGLVQTVQCSRFQLLLPDELRHHPRQRLHADRTSTNLVVHGLLLEKRAPRILFFELGRVGLPVALVANSRHYLVLHRLLPKRKEAVEQLGETRVSLLWK